MNRLLGKFVKLHRDQRGTTTLEWTLLLAGFAIPALLIMAVAFNLLVAHYQMVTTLNALPFP